MENKNLNKKINSKNFEKHTGNENPHLEYLEHWNFEKNLKKLSKKLKNKKVLIYGAGAFFKTVTEYFDLSELNIIGIADMKFKEHGENETFLDYKVFSPFEIKNLNPDYILVSVLKDVGVREDLEDDLADTKIKILPLVRKEFWALVREVWG